MKGIIFILALLLVMGCETLNLKGFKMNKDGVEVESIETTDKTKVETKNQCQKFCH